MQGKVNRSLFVALKNVISFRVVYTEQSAFARGDYRRSSRFYTVILAIIYSPLRPPRIFFKLSFNLILNNNGLLLLLFSGCRFLPFVFCVVCCVCFFCLFVLLRLDVSRVSLFRVYFRLSVCMIVIFLFFLFRSNMCRCNRHSTPPPVLCR